MALPAQQTAIPGYDVHLDFAPDLLVQKRDGSLIPFDMSRICAALEKAFRADLQTPVSAPLDDFSLREIREISGEAERKIGFKKRKSSVVHIEEIQDLVEILLMQHGHYSVAKLYILYRDKRAQARGKKE